MKVTGENLSMTRGDSETVTVSCPERPFTAGDIIEMTVRKTATSTEKEIYKRVADFNDGVAVINIDPEDTSGLSFGNHVYDVQLTTGDGKVITIIKPHVLYLDKEVSYG